MTTTLLHEIAIPLVVFFALGAWAISARAQESAADRFKGGRGDVHSSGFETVTRLKGEPLAPRFPEIGPASGAVERAVLSSGTVIFLKEDHRLPLIRIEAILRGGSAYETPATLAVADLTASQMRDGGTALHAAQALDDRLAFLAARVSVNAGDESITASLDVLSKDFDEAFALFFEVLTRPAFDPARLELARRRGLFGLWHRNDNPGVILDREYTRLLYGESHPRGFMLTPERLNAIGRDDLVAYHERIVRPDNLWITAVGDFRRTDVAAKLEKALEALPKPAAPLPLPPLPKATGAPRPGVYVVNRPITQSNIAVGHPGISRDNPDRYAVDLMNRILGGGSFSSRITERVRSDEGLAYSARSAYPIGDRDLGLFRATVQTKTESTGRAVALILEEIEKMQSGAISKNEFETARESVLYGFVNRFDDPVQNVVRLMRLEFEGLPYDWDRRAFEGYSAVKPEDVASAARKYLRPSDLTIFVVGDAAAMGKDLEAFGKPTPVVIQDFAPPGGRKANG
ncbi:MAG: insulinase family protein [Planctomycetes bacterium]|nr:insulinase family protein [Planctomycetota bacterium]MBI3845720.1 insulinase family protein [Planctomycetota bacterium]